MTIYLTHPDKSYKTDCCDRAAEWIPPWTGGLRLITLSDMKEYLANRLVSISNCLTRSGFVSFLSTGDQRQSLNQEEQDKIIKYLATVDRELQFLGLEMTRISVTRVQARIGTISNDDLAEQLDLISDRFNDEIQSLSFLYLAPDKRHYFAKTDLFGDEVKNRFPSANIEIIEAGNCLALGRFTACVYHLTRAMEISLRVLFTGLGMPSRVWSTTKWSRILDRIKGKIEKNNKTLANDYEWQTNRGFYENAHAFLAAVRVPICNSTMHVESVYDETGAENVFGAVKTFIRHLATKLAEVRPGSGIDSLPRKKP